MHSAQWIMEDYCLNSSKIYFGCGTPGCLNLILEAFELFQAFQSFFNKTEGLIESLRSKPLLKVHFLNIINI